MGCAQAKEMVAQAQQQEQEMLGPPSKVQDASELAQVSASLGVIGGQESNTIMCVLTNDTSASRLHGETSIGSRAVGYVHKVLGSYSNDSSTVPR